MSVVQGLFVHSDYLDLYGLSPETYSNASRTTLPLEDRLQQVIDISDAPLSETRAIEHRAIGTCRDYAVMLCGILIEKSVVVRIRCGFATYFTPDRYEDHWLCEYWNDDEDRWIRVDAQLDAPHRAHLEIDFSPLDVPADRFLTASEAWHLSERKNIPADHFGHGESSGLWFMLVNLARDYLSLCGQEVSAWDGWRNALGRLPQQEETLYSQCRDLAAAIREGETNAREPKSEISLQPFWLDT